MKKKFFLCFFWIFQLAAQAQKHDFIWLGSYCPTNRVMDFNTMPPNIYPISLNYPMFRENLIMSDENGDLIFYSAGCSIRNKAHKIMKGGDSLNVGPDYSLHCQSFYLYPRTLFALPIGDQAYYVFHIRSGDYASLNARCGGSALLHSKIDMRQENGLGAVVFKDSLLLEGCFQRACAVRHANGRDWWVIAASNEREEFYRFLVSPEGIQGPWKQTLANPTVKDLLFLGWMATSPDGSKLFIDNNFYGCVLYDLDRCSGLLSDMRTIHTRPSGAPGTWAGPGFSPDSRFFYCVTDSTTAVRQYDLKAPDWARSEVLLAKSGYFNTNPPFVLNHVFRGLDGKLYIANGGSPEMHVIHFPCRSGKACQLQIRALTKLPGYNFGAFYHPNYRLGPLDNSPCDTLGLDNRPVALFRHDLEDTAQVLRLTFTDLSYYEPAEWSWDFGDPASGAANMSRDTNPVHVFSKPGRYRVCLTVRNAHASDVFCRDIEVGSTGTEWVGEAAAGVLLSPNPVAEHLRVELRGLYLKNAPENQAQEVSVIDVSGKVLLTKKFVSEDDYMDVRDLSDGVYFIVVPTAENGKKVYRFTKFGSK